MIFAQTVMAFDFGLKRTGVAIGNTHTKTSQALTILSSKNANDRLESVRRLIDEWHPQLLVVGLPLHPDGVSHEMTAKATRFGNQLKGRFHLPVVWVDERYTSVTVENGDDSLAAQLILDQYLNTV